MTSRPTFLLLSFVLFAGCPRPDVDDDDVVDDDDSATDPADLDGDGWTAGSDCDDNDPEVHPGAPEWCNGVDDDCDDVVDEDAVDAISWWRDGDQDGFGVGVVELAREAPPGGTWVTNSEDCDDTDPDVNPWADEICDDGVDNDCDGHQLTGCGPCAITVPVDVPMIAAALNQAGTGDRICVQAGTYNESLVLPANDWAPAAAGMGDGATLRLTNGIVVYNNSGAYDDFDCTSGTCVLETHYTTLWNDTIAGAVTVVGSFVEVYPEFMEPSAADPSLWDVHLIAASASVDAGDQSVLDPDGSVSDPGPYGGAGADGWDLDGDGFFEWWLPGPYDPATSPGLDCDDSDASVYPGVGC